MHKQYGRQVLRFDPGRQGEIRGQLEPVTRWNAHRLHRSELLLVEPRRHLGQLAELIRSTVIVVKRPARTVAVSSDDEFVLLTIGRAEHDLLAGELFLQLGLEVAAPVVEKMVFLLVAGKSRGGEHLALVRTDQTADIDLGMFEDDLLLLPRGGIEAHDGRLVAADIGRGIEILVVVGEEERIGAFAEVGANHLLEWLVRRGAGEQLGIDAVGLHRGPHLTVVVRDPGGDTAGILRDQFHLPVAGVEPEDIKDTRVAFVHADQEMVLIITQVIDHADPHPGKGREVAAVAAVGVDRVEMEILVSAVVLQVDDLVLRRPKVAGNVTLGRIGQALRVAATHRLDENIEAVFPRRHPRNVVAAGTDLIGRTLRIAEKIAQGNDGRRFHGFGRTDFHGGRKGG